MSLQLVLGPSGSGKSSYIYDRVIKTAAENPKQSYLVIVPDQFTMQTQADLVSLSKQGGYMVSAGIMNIDVLSFSRLAHRIFGETGGGRRPVLDDTGKNLILRKCASDVREQIPYLADKLDKAGYIHEVKSAISEFMQYGLGINDVNEIADYAKEGNRKALENKLRCLSVIYGRFKEYLSENYITTEETMDILASEIYKSRITRDCVVVFDGFTGFTPIQNKVIGALMSVASEVIVTITMDEPFEMTNGVNEQSLFAFSAKTYSSLRRIADDCGCEILDDYIIEPGARFADNAELHFLERHLYRYDGLSYSHREAESNEEYRSIRLENYRNISEEVRGLISNIRYLTCEKNVSYMDIAVISGNLSAYRSEIEEQFDIHNIPVYIDETSGITMNPFVEFVRAVLDMYVSNFTYDSVFRYLRTGFSSLNRDEIDKLENYVIETGIRGQKAYRTMFTRKTEAMKRAERYFEKNRGSSDEVSPVLEMINEINNIRATMMGDIETLVSLHIDSNSQDKASVFVKAIYGLLTDIDAAGKLEEYRQLFADMNDFSREKEYAQIYKKTMNMFEQIYSLIGDEVMSLEEFARIIDAGFDELKIGTIPLSVDRIIVGDMERTRLKPVKYLFFLGLNDGWVPKSGGKGGIISDAEREFLVESGRELAPSPRQQMYIDRFYLYLNLTKPSEGLFLSYISMDSESKAMRPSYMVEQIGKMFPGIGENNKISSDINRIESMSDARLKLAELLRRYAEGANHGEMGNELKLMTDFFTASHNMEFLEKMLNNAFFRYRGKYLDERIAGLLYGVTMYGSISRMEKFATCAYAYFLKYGLSLEERREYGLEKTDLGNIYHGVLDIFIDKLEKNGADWFNFSDELARQLVDEAVEEEAARYTDALLFENNKNRYIADRMKYVMLRTVKTLSYQLRNSAYVPIDYEMDFVAEKNLDVINVALDEPEKLRLRGKIDRLDADVRDDKVYVKVVDYKSSSKDFSLMSFYKGVQLQMVVYLEAALDAARKRYPGKEAVPAALLYYHIDDPIIEGEKAISDEEIEAHIRKALRTKGIISADSEIISGLDKSGNQKSDIIPVDYLKDGSYSKSSEVTDPENMQLLSDYAGYKIKSIAKDIIAGKIALNPIELKNSPSQVVMDSCAYCDYKHVCGFDKHMPGYQKETIMKMEEADILNAMKNELSADSE